jgi:hypothetical protein
MHSHPKLALGFGTVAIVSLSGLQWVSYSDPYAPDTPTVPLAAFMLPATGSTVTMGGAICYALSPIDDSERAWLAAPSLPPARAGRV